MRRALIAVLLLCSAGVGFGQAAVAAPDDTVRSGRLVTYVAPTAPATEKAPYHSVTFEATLGEDGRLHSLAAFTPADPYVQTAVDAASQWIYEPFTRGGKPMAVSAVVSVVFSGNPHRSATDTPVRVSETMMAHLIDHKVAPAPKSFHGSGSVVLLASIGREGRVDSLQVVSGPENLRPAALDAARQWTYRPYLMDGEPTSIQTTLMMNFSR